MSQAKSTDADSAASLSGAQATSEESGALPDSAEEPRQGDSLPGHEGSDIKTVARVNRSAVDKPVDSSSTLPIPRWAFNLIGHVLAALLGLAIGYWILSQLKPQTFPLPWW
jgi:hypothetical protein